MKKLLWLTLAVVFLLLPLSCKKEMEIPDPVVPVVLKDGPLLSGRVRDSAGDPVAGAVVTDGFVQAETDAEGNFSFLSPYPERVHFVSVRIPSGYNPVVREGRPVFYGSVPSYDGKERQADIVLKKRSGETDRFSMMMIADPQSKPFRLSTASENFAYASRDVVEDLFAEMRRTVPTVSSPLYGMCLGDIANGNPDIYPQYCLGLASLGIPFFNVIGNHDHFFTGAETDDDSAAAFEAIFGPRNYSFDVGQIHFVVLDNCIYVKDLRTYPMKYGLEDEFLEWLKGDLARVPKDMPVMICTHANVFNDTGVNSWTYEGIDCSYKFDEFLQAIQGFDKLYVWAGHYHVGWFVGRINTMSNPSGVETFVLARSTGVLAGNEYVTSDGTPQGFVMLEANGKELSWKFHPVTSYSAPFRGPEAPNYTWRPAFWDENTQMRAYSRGTYDDDFVYANIYLWDPSWETPVLNVGGIRYPMTPDYVYDRPYREVVRFYRKRGIPSSQMGDYASSGKKHHFRIRVPDGASGQATVEVTDRFGRTWAQEVSVDPVRYQDGFRHVVFDFRTAPAGCPTTVSQQVSLNCKATDGGSYAMTLSSGCYQKAAGEEEGYLLLSGDNSTLSLPALPGCRLVGVTLHPSGNTKASCKGRVTDPAGNTVAGGELLAFYGNCADSWELEKMEEALSYRLTAVGGNLCVGELRLTYSRIVSANYSGDTDDYSVDAPLDFKGL